MQRRFWHYSGDANLEHGGFYYCLASWRWDYVDVLRVVPCSDAYGPDNEFWIEWLTVNLPRGYERTKRLEQIENDYASAHKSLTRTQLRHALVDWAVGYGAYDQRESCRIRIGTNPDKRSLKPQWGNTEPDQILRGNTTLERFVRRCLRTEEIADR